MAKTALPLKQAEPTKPIEVSTGLLKVACITCYGDPDYVRSRTIRAALAAMPDVETIIVKNRSKGAKRYIEVLAELWRVKRQLRPDVYLLNFRGYELLLPVLLIAGKKPVIFDEFINPMLVVREHRMKKRGLVKLLMGAWDAFGWFYHALVRHVAVILTDTPAHGRYSAALSGIDAGRYKALPVGTDETLFKPALDKPAAERAEEGGKNDGSFQVFFYSTGSQPLHGMPVIMEAAALLADRKDITFLVSGNKGAIAEQVAAAREKGARIEHKSWIPFDELPSTIRKASVCLGGPFGGTQQAQLVITGKTYQFLACQSPVIVGASPATSDFIDRQNSLVVPQDDAQALATAITWAADHPQELAAIAANGRKLFEEHYSTKVIASEITKIISVVRKTPSL
jgi:glycosyltransferase involved in cell wall biosynthesis